MLTSIFKIAFRLKGFSIKETIPADIKKCVVIAAPHTSNWDFVYAIAMISILKTKFNYFIKSELFKWPLKNYLIKTGGIAVDRKSNNNFVDQCVSHFEKNERFVLVVPPEGTRSKVKKWKSGFYHIALGAKVPLFLGYIDYEKRTIGFGKMMMLSGDKEKDIAEIRKFYSNVHAKYPDKFTIDSINF